MTMDNEIHANNGCIHCDNSNGSNYGFKTYCRVSNAGNNSNDCNHRYCSFHSKISIDERQKIFNDEIVILSVSSSEGNMCRNINELVDNFYQ